MKTVSVKKGEFEQDWHVVNADGEVLGRLASNIAIILRGKNKPIFTPHVDTGDFVIVVNAEKVKLTGKKLKDKKYYRHTGHPGGIKEITDEKLLEKKPEELIKRVVRGMLPKNKIGRKMLTKLKVYSGPKHPHDAQKPKPLNLS